MRQDRLRSDARHVRQLHEIGQEDPWRVRVPPPALPGTSGRVVAELLQQRVADCCLEQSLESVGQEKQRGEVVFARRGESAACAEAGLHKPHPAFELIVQRKWTRVKRRHRSYPWTLARSSMGTEVLVLAHDDDGALPEVLGLGLLVA